MASPGKVGITNHTKPGTRDLLCKLICLVRRIKGRATTVFNLLHKNGGYESDHSAQTTSSCFLSKRSFLLPAKNLCATTLCFNRRAFSLKSKRPFSCNAIYNPQLKLKSLKSQKQKWRLLLMKLLLLLSKDTKKGKLRYYPYNINWNYGLLPQTWEDPSQANSEVEGAFVDVVEIGEAQRKIGEVLKIKPLAALAMIDEGELDWKIVAISLDDPKAHLVNDVDDVEKHFPGTLTAIRDWFRDYKIPDGKPANRFGLGDKPAYKDYALKIIHETNESWAKLVKRSVDAGDLSLF
ncbi:unnamed protein product [Eruca vesicaria subsp. sativa]|uniref:inorganic diphosphatase n=1 Tax=Eruca vesicaria subsp. sativa TaxID=29727 RepID=A0ABC8JCS5_ERUVS|nr:unnamed protein product [Eruca vesicaria subsp. sativa]